MRTLIFWKNLIYLTFRKLCRQRMLLAGFALLCVLLPLAAGPAAEAALSRGVSFSGITLAIVAPEGDPVSAQLEQVLSGMEDISRYCRIKAMNREEAVEGLEHGEVTATLVLPEHFIQGVLNGSNPDVDLIVRGDRPLESLLTLWVGRSASELLTAVQSGIYAVLDLYEQSPPAELDYQDVMLRINMRYISWTLNRQELYRIREIPVTENLPIGTHYSLSLFACLILALSPMFAGIYDPRWICPQKRCRALGIGWAPFCAAAMTVCALTEALLIAVFQIVVLESSLFDALWSGMLCGLFCGMFASLCCLATADTGSCGVLSFLCSLGFLALSGGILPPVLMPGFLQDWVRFSPITWLRNAMAVSQGHELQAFPAMALICSSLAMAGCAGVLYARRGSKEVTAP